MKKREHSQPISEVRFMITLRSVADVRRFLTSLPVTLLSLVVAACVLITPVAALAQTNDSPYGEPEKVCYRMIKRTDEQIVLSFNPYCDLRRLAYAFPIRDEDGKVISVQKYLQTLYAVNGRYRTDGQRSSVKGGCVRPGKPSPDATPGELAACPDGLMNYYATPNDDSMATIIVPSARQLTYEEKLNKRIKDLEKENAELKQTKTAEQPNAAKPAVAAPAPKPTDNGPEMANVKADNDKLRAENVSLINWTYLLASTIFLMLIALGILLYMWWRADKRRPVKLVFDEAAWDKRERKLTEALQATMDAKLAAKDEEILALQKEREEATQKIEALEKETVEKAEELKVARALVTAKEQENATLTEERDKAVQTVGTLQDNLAEKTKELQEERDSKDPTQQDVDVQQMARDLMACKLRTQRLSEEKISLQNELSSVRAFADQFADANRICNGQLTDAQSELTAVKQERDQAQSQAKSLGEQLAAKQQELQDANSALEAFKADAASAIRGKEQAERQIESLQTQLATMSLPATVHQPSDHVPSALGDFAQAQAKVQELELQVRTLSSDKTELEGRLVTMTERAEGAERTIRDFQSTFGPSSVPPSANNSSAVTPPDQSLAPEGAKGGTDYSTETRDRDGTVHTSAVASTGSAKSDPPEIEINAAEREAAVQEAVVLDQLREYLNQCLRAKETRDNLLSRISYLSTVSEETEREVLDHDGDAKVVNEGRAKIKRVRDHIAKLRDDLVEANGLLSKLEKFGREHTFGEFAFSQPEENLDKRIERLVEACRKKAFEDLHDPSSPIYNCLPVTQDKKEHEDYELLLAAAKRANSMLGEDPKTSEAMDAEKLAVAICTRAMTVMGKASSDSQSFDTAKQRVEKLEASLADEREKHATERTKAFRLANECEDLRQEVSTLKGEKDGLETRLANLLENYQRDVTRNREEHDKINERGRTPEARLALANLRVAEADQRAAEARYACDAMQQDNQLVQGVVQRLLGLLVSNSGEPVDLHDQRVAAELQRLNDSLRKVSSRLNLQPTTPVPESPTESRMQMRAVSKVGSPEVRTALEKRLSQAEWGEVQYLAKLMMRETVMRRMQHTGIIFMVDTTEELHMLHAFLHMPVECGRQVDRECVVQVPVPQLYHLSDNVCAEPTNGSSGMLSSPGTMRPSLPEQPVPRELGGLIPPRSSHG